MCGPSGPPLALGVVPHSPPCWPFPDLFVPTSPVGPPPVLLYALSLAFSGDTIAGCGHDPLSVSSASSAGVEAGSPCGPAPPVARPLCRRRSRPPSSLLVVPTTPVGSPPAIICTSFRRSLCRRRSVAFPGVTAFDRVMGGRVAAAAVLPSTWMAANDRS